MDVEHNVRDIRMQNETFTTGKYDESIDDNLPPTVTLLTTPDGGKLYLVGTAHFSVESQNDVSKVINFCIIYYIYSLDYSYSNK